MTDMATAAKIYELGFNHGADNALNSFCDMLIRLSGEAAMQGVSSDIALVTVARSMRKAGNLPFSVEAFGLPNGVGEALAAILEKAVTP